ncbi:MAG: TIGR03557 family F420-dependent LLM class oxidoreductase [Thermoleophilia bacterium]|nr:TIGR03557 family F420-dependent LLM class oxidoreductase [Thermoleophilia bacterium]
MTELGYWLSSEEHAPNDLVRNAARAEELGFAYAMISDHYHPWVDAQGNSPFVWSVLGGIAQATERLELATGVTCPLIRTHPAIVAHAAATVAAMMPGRFTLGVGTGENLNEHVLGDRWPAPDERIELLEEAIEVMRLLWQGGEQTHRGRHYTVDHATLYTLPEQPIPIAVAAAKPNAAELAGRVGDGLVSTEPNEETVQQYRDGGGDGPCWGQVRICWAESEEEARQTIHRLWRYSRIGGTINVELPRPSDFDAAAESVTVEMAVDGVPCGPDPEPVVELVRQWERAGFDRIAFHQVGLDQEGFFRFWEQELRPRLD